MKIDRSTLPSWQQDARSPVDYHYCEATRGREFIFRLNTGGDPVLAIEEFARDKGIRFAKVHATFMGGFQPCKYLVWIPDYKDPENWHLEGEAVNTNLSMVTSIGGVIHPRPDGKGGWEPCAAIHFVAGGGWDCPVLTGHLQPGTRVQGCFQVFITEMDDIDVLLPVDEYDVNDDRPENFYQSTNGREGR